MWIQTLLVLRPQAGHLYQVARNKNVEFVEAAFGLLLQAGAVASGHQTHCGDTLMHLAAKRCNPFLIRNFAELGVPLNFCDEKGRTHLHRVICAKLPTREAVYRKLIRYGASTEKVEQLGISALHVTSGVGDNLMVEEFLKVHGKPDVDIEGCQWTNTHYVGKLWAPGKLVPWVIY